MLRIGYFTLVRTSAGEVILLNRFFFSFFCLSSPPSLVFVVCTLGGLLLCRASEAAKAAIESPLLDFPVTDAKVN